MRILASIALFALLTCHPTGVAAGQRPKRTIKMLENLIDTMRQTFGADPAPPPPAEVIARVTKLPYGMKYTYYPAVRMHIRPVEKHIIYVKPMPMPAPMTIHQMPSDVDIIRFVQPIVRMPKTKTTTTIHYEIIPVPMPIHASALQPEPGPTPGHTTSVVGEHEELNQVPWSMDALPPPVPTSKPADPIEEPLIPWNLHALPPPIATKRPHWQPDADWTHLRPMPQFDKHGFMIPLMQKKLVIPAQAAADFGHGQMQQNAFFDSNAKKFVPSPLHSEISVQPSLEIAAFSETDSVAQPRARSRFPKHTKAQVQRQHPRLRRDTWSHFPTSVAPQTSRMSNDTNSPTIVSSVEYILKGNSSLPVFSSPIPLASLTFNARKFSKELPSFEDPIIGKGVASNLYDYEKFGTKTKKFNLTDGSIGFPTTVPASSTPFITQSTAATKLPVVLDFGEYSDNEDADKEDAHLAQTEHRESNLNFTDDLVSIVRAPDWLSEPAPEEYVPITPKPGNYTRNFIDASRARLTNKANADAPNYSTSRQDFRDFHVNPSPAHEFRSQQQRDAPSFFDSSKLSGLSVDSLKLPETSLFSRFPGEDNYRDLFHDRPPSLSDRYRLSDKSNKFDFRIDNERRDKLPYFDYDNIEYFEPIVIDIDKERPKSDFSSKLKYKYKNIGKSKTSSDEPLKLPDSLHETIDFFKKRSMHPPIFDLEGDASESKLIAIIDGNEIT